MLESIEKVMDKEPPDDAVQRALNATPFMAEYRKKVALSFAGVIGALLCMGIFYITAKRIKPPELMFISSGNQVYKIEALPLPMQTREGVQAWVREAIQKTYTFDFLNLGDQLTAAKPYFTPDAWSLFKQVVQNSELVKQAEKNRLQVGVVLQTDPVFAGTAINATGEFAWKVVVPITISFTGDIPTQSQNVVIRATVIRVPTTENPKGLGIVQMTAEPMSSSAAR